MPPLARPRDGHKPVAGPVEAGEVLRGREKHWAKDPGLLFGRERIGLRNWEISLADEIVTFPVNPAYASLNIAQAVLLMSYEWMKSGLETPPPDSLPTNPTWRPLRNRTCTGCSSRSRRGLMRGAISAPRPSG